MLKNFQNQLFKHVIMDLLDYTRIWARGEVIQGRIMVLAGIVLIIAAVAIFKSDNSFLKGALVPISLAILILCGYGGFQVTTRPAYADNVAKTFTENPNQAIEHEYTKAQKDDNTYKILKKVWIILIIVSALSFFLFSTEFLNGLSVGFIGLFFCALVIDSNLHQRLLEYMKSLENILK